MIRRILLVGSVAMTVQAIWPITASGADLAAEKETTLAQKDKQSGNLTFEVYSDARKEWRWRLLAANGKNLATSGQGYKRKASCTDAIDRIKSDAGSGKVKFDVYQDKASEYRWRLKAANGQTIGQSSEGYKAKADCEHAVDLVKAGAAKAVVREAKKE